MSTNIFTQEYVPYRVVVDDVVPQMTPLSTSLNVGALWIWPSDRSRWVIVARRFLVASCCITRHLFVFIGAVQPLPILSTDTASTSLYSRSSHQAALCL